MTQTARPPRQDRGIRRVARLLDAAAEEILLTGVEGLTMSAVARRAATAAGSLYQFFPTRAALLAALAERYETALAAIAEDVAARLRAQPAPGIAATALAFLRPFIDWYAANPAYLVLIEAMPRVLPPDRLADPRVAAALAECLAPHVAPDARPRLDTAARLMVEVGHAAIGAAPQGDATARAQWLAEAEQVIALYAASLARPVAAPPG